MTGMFPKTHEDRMYSDQMKMSDAATFTQACSKTSSWTGKTSCVSAKKADWF